MKFNKTFMWLQNQYVCTFIVMEKYLLFVCMSKMKVFSVIFAEIAHCFTDYTPRLTLKYCQDNKCLGCRNLITVENKIKYYLILNYPPTKWQTLFNHFLSFFFHRIINFALRAKYNLKEEFIVIS